MTRVINPKTGKHYEDGDIVQYKGKEEKIEKRTVKIQSVQEIDKQLLVRLLQKDGTVINACFWFTDNNNENINLFVDIDGKHNLVEASVGDTIDIYGFEYLYNGYRQFSTIGGYVLHDDALELESDLDVSSIVDKIERYLSYINDQYLKQTCYDMLDELGKDFYMRPAASKCHHNYVGGLLQHTYEVIASACVLTTIFKADISIIVAAALFHDSMKVKEYTNEGDYLPYAKNVGHVVGSADYFKGLAIKNGVAEGTIEKVFHCILAHHGRQEWGSPVEPQTIEAVIVHEADMISSNINPIALKELNNKKDYYLTE